MDLFLLDFFESIMNRSIISPYAWARYLIIGSLLFWVFLNAHDLVTAHWLTLVECTILMMTAHFLYQQAIWPERRNRRAFSNTLRIDHRTARYTCLWFLTCSLLLVPPHYHRIHVICVAFFTILTIHQYLISLNWIKPGGLSSRRSTHRLRKKKSCYDT
jgi:hypothetical protein